MSPSVLAAVLAAVLACPLRAATDLSPEDLVTAGRCSGRGGTASRDVPASPLFDRRRHPFSEDWREMFEAAGYRVEPVRVLSPQGRPLGEAEVGLLTSPFDASVDTLDPQAWASLISRGYRLEEPTCRLLDPDTRRPITRLELEASRALPTQAYRQAAIERLVSRLRLVDPSAPPPFILTDDMMRLEQGGARLPEPLRQALLEGRMSSKRLGENAEALYDAGIRGWSGARDLKELAKDALPPVPGWTSPALKPGRIEPWEQELGDLLSGKIAARFSRTPSGRELLDHLRSKGGSIDLPPMTVLKISQNPADTDVEAFYNDESRSFVFNHWAVVRHALEDAPPAERAHLAVSLASARGLANYLRDHPQAADKLVDRIDVVTYHELTHAWQNRRQLFARESARGNAPSDEPIEWEHEAYFAESRYLHDKLMLDPTAALRSGWVFNFYLQMLQDPAALRNSITSTYLTGTGVADTGAIKSIQRERTAVLLRLPPVGAESWTKRVLRAVGARRILRAVGIVRGDLAIARTESDERAQLARLTRFVPQMRRDAARVLPDALEKAGRPDVALKVLDALPGAASPEVVRRRAQLTKETSALLVQNKLSPDLDERFAAYGLVAAELSREGASDPSLDAARARDARLQAQRYMDKAAADQNDASLDTAASYWDQTSPRHDAIEARAAAVLPAHFAAAGRPDKALEFLDRLSPAGQKAVDLARRRGFEVKTEELLTRKDDGLTMDERLDAFQAVRGELERENRPWTDGLGEAYNATLKENVEAYLDEARSATDEGDRRRLFQSAHDWAESVTPRDQALISRVDEESARSGR